jgi:TRAP-type C4-dicarboxylate transport system substrate-binding protein
MSSAGNTAVSTRTGPSATMAGEGSAMNGWGRRLTVVIATAVIAAACGGSPGGSPAASPGSKAGGDAPPVVLRMADPYETSGFEPAVAAFVGNVERLSGGQVKVEHVVGWGELTPAIEQQIVRDVAAGTADLGWVGTRAFDMMGVHAFQALTAPMLIDSYPLQEAVITSDIPAAMLDRLDSVGVTGLAVLGDALRKPLARERPLLELGDWKGVSFNVFNSKAAIAAIAATGATPAEAFGGAEYAAAERGLLIYEQNYVEDLPFVTANVNLWPQTVAIVANPAALARLTEQQRAWVQQAADDAATGSTAMFDRDQDFVVSTCALGGRYALASPAALTSLRNAFGPVYDALTQDAQTKEFIEQIEALKRTVGVVPGLSIPRECAADAPPPAANILEGAWQTDQLLEGDVVRAFVLAGGSETEAHAWFAQLGGGPQRFATLRLVFGRGSVDQFEAADGGTMVKGSGQPYRIEGDTLINGSGPCTPTFRIDIQGDTLRLHPITTCPNHDSPYETSIYGSFAYARTP